jgi:hypothetical protein
MSTREQVETMKRRKAFLQNTLQNIEWAFQLLAIYTIPILFASSVILGMQVGGYIDKAGTVGGPLCWAAGAALMTAIELSMLGSFGLAAAEMKNGQKWRGALLFIMGLAFIVITIVTLSFSKDGVDSGATNTLSIVRLSAAVLYAVLAHGVTTSTDTEDLVVTPDLYEELTNKIQVIEQSVKGFTEYQEKQNLLVTEALQRIALAEENSQKRIAEFAPSLKGFSETVNSQILEISETLQRIDEERFSPIVENLQLHAEALSALPLLSERVEQIESAATYQLRVVTEEVTQVKVTLEQHTLEFPKLAQRIVSEGYSLNPPTAEKLARVKGAAKPSVNTLVKGKVKGKSEETPKGDFDKKQFVFDCLTEDAKMSISEMQRKAQAINQTIATGYISMKRKEFFEEHPEALQEENVIVVDADMPEASDVHTDPDLVAIGD